MTTVVESKSNMFAQVQLDPGRTVECAAGALAAYADFDDPANIKIPPGYRFVARFTGWDRFLFVTGREEKFGLLLQSKTNPTTYMLCFRGTDSPYDDWEDLFSETAKFVPTSNDGKLPNDVYVAAGFYGIYNEKSHNMPMSMRQQVFALLDHYKPKDLIVCGHSLGSSLSTLFTLDAAVSRPAINVINTNFASPCTGTTVWRNTYNHTYALNSKTFRIANYFDWVPSYPPLPDYAHVGKRFYCAFYVDGALTAHPLSRHSMLNYQYVVAGAVFNTPQVWTGVFPDFARNGWQMRSVTPPSATFPAWAAHLQSMQEAALAEAAEPCEP